MWLAEKRNTKYGTPCVFDYKKFFYNDIFIRLWFFHWPSVSPYKSLRPFNRSSITVGVTTRNYYYIENVRVRFPKKERQLFFLFAVRRGKHLFCGSAVKSYGIPILFSLGNLVGVFSARPPPCTGIVLQCVGRGWTEMYSSMLWNTIWMMSIRFWK